MALAAPRGWFCWLLVVLIATTTQQASCQQQQQPQPQHQGQQPNIVLMLADDVGWADPQRHDPSMRTPGLQRLADGGVLLTQAYVQSTCAPTRSALLTGRYVTDSRFFASSRAGTYQLAAFTEGTSRCFTGGTSRCFTEGTSRCFTEGTSRCFTEGTSR